MTFDNTEVLDKLDDQIGNATGMAITATLRVSPNGSGADGKSWLTAYTTIQDALDEASTDGNDCTEILVGPHATFYDIAAAGDPTWTGNYEIRGTHRIWAAVRNEHGSATSVMNFSGKASIQDLAIFTFDSVNGVSFSGNGWRVRKCGFNSSGTSGANTSVHIDGSGGLIKGGIMEDVQFVANVTFTTGIHVEKSSINEFSNIHLHTCLVGLHITDSDSANNHFEDFDIGDCALGMDLDAGDDQHFENITFHGNTRNVDDEVGTHTWVNINGAFDIAILPDDLDGTSVSTGGAGAYGSDTELLSALSRDNPFRIVGMNLEVTTSEWYQVRFTENAGAPYYDMVQFDATKQAGASAPSGTEHIFNKGTRISCSARDETGGDTVNVWLQVQEI